MKKKNLKFDLEGWIDGHFDPNCYLRCGVDFKVFLVITLLLSCFGLLRCCKIYAAWLDKIVNIIYLFSFNVLESFMQLPCGMFKN